MQFPEYSFPLSLVLTTSSLCCNFSKTNNSMLFCYQCTVFTGCSFYDLFGCEALNSEWLRVLWLSLTYTRLLFSLTHGCCNLKVRFTDWEARNTKSREEFSALTTVLNPSLFIPWVFLRVNHSRCWLCLYLNAGICGSTEKSFLCVLNMVHSGLLAFLT